MYINLLYGVMFLSTLTKNEIARRFPLVELCLWEKKHWPASVLCILTASSKSKWLLLYVTLIYKARKLVTVREWRCIGRRSVKTSSESTLIILARDTNDDCFSNAAGQIVIFLLIPRDVGGLPGADLGTITTYRVAHSIKLSIFRSKKKTFLKIVVL